MIKTTKAQGFFTKMAPNLRRIVLPAILMAVFVATAPPALAIEKIAAVVNDEVISYFDLDARLSLVLSGTRVPDTPETRRRLAPQILRRLIDETLQLQESKRLKIEVNDADLQRAFSHIERQNKVPPGQIDAFLASRGVDKLSLTAQLEAEIAWGKLVNRRLRQQIQISTEDIDEALARMKAAEGKPEYLMAEIFLPVDAPERENEVKQLAIRAIQQMRKGASFSALARNFSRSASAPEGGDLGWVRQGDLGPDIDKVMTKMEAGQLAGPVRTISGYHILLLREKRTSQGIPMPDISVTLQQLFFPVPDNAGEAEIGVVEERAKTAAATATDCPAMETIATELATPLSGSLGTVKLSSLPDSLRNAVTSLELNTPSAPIRTANGVVVMMVCERDGEPSQDKVRNQIERIIYNQRLDVAAQRYLRDLRRAAFIDVRL